MTKSIALAVLLALTSGTAQAQSWTATGAHGGSASGMRDCSVTDGARTCTGTRTVTGAYGRTYSTESERVTQYGATSATGTRTGTYGGTISFTRNWNR